MSQREKQLAREIQFLRAEVSILKSMIRAQGVLDLIESGGAYQLDLPSLVAKRLATGLSLGHQETETGMLFPLRKLDWPRQQHFLPPERWIEHILRIIAGEYP